MKQWLIRTRGAVGMGLTCGQRAVHSHGRRVRRALVDVGEEVGARGIRRRRQSGL